MYMQASLKLLNPCKWCIIFNKLVLADVSSNNIAHYYYIYLAQFTHEETYMYKI